jgi:TM2 domain-containing membrane protein YozV
MSNLSMEMKKDLTQGQLALLGQELDDRKKSKVVMWLLWLFTGGIGGHRYYLGDTGRGVAMTLTLGGLGIWALIDAFFISKRLATKNEEIELQLIDRVKTISS